MPSWKDDQVIEDTPAASPSKSVVDQIPGGGFYENRAKQPAAAPLSALDRAVGMGSPAQRLTGGMFVKPIIGANQLFANALAGGSDFVQRVQGNNYGGEGPLRSYANSANALAQQYAEQERVGQEANKVEIPVLPDVGGEGFNLLGLAGAVASPFNKLFGGGVQPATKVGRIVEGAKQGAVMAAVTPTEGGGSYSDKKMQDLLLGSLLGGAFPLAAMTLKGAKNLISEFAKPLTMEGKQKLVRDWFENLLPADREKAIAALKNPNELVPGSKPTASQAMADMPGSTTIAAAEQALSKSPDKGNTKKYLEASSQRFAQRAADQQAARESAISSIARTKDELEAAITDRKDFSEAFYGVAYKQLTDFNPQLKGMMETPAFRAAIPKALDIAKNNGFQTSDDLAKLVTYAPDFFKGAAGAGKKEVVNSNLTQFLHFVKKAMDEQVAIPANAGGLGATEKAAVQNVRKQLVSWMGKNNAYYDDARQVYGALSPKIDQMRIGQVLLDKLKSPMDVERAGVFAQAVFDAPKTLKKATGETMYDTIEQALTPKQAAAVRAVEADLKRAAKTRFNAEKTNISGVTPDNSPELPALLNTAATVTNTVLRLIKKDVNSELNATITELLLDPPKLAGFLSMMPKEPGKSRALAEALMKKLTPENQAALAAQLAAAKEE